MGLRSPFRSKRAHAHQHRNRRLFMEALEPRLALTWAGVPPLNVTPTNPVTVTLNANGDASGTASIATTEVDYYAFTTTAAGSFTFSATTPSSNLDTVIGVFSSTGQRITYNDDLSPGNTDSRVTANLLAGSYYLGVTNFSSISRGAYTYTIDYSAPIPQADDLYENNDTFATAYDLRTLSATRTISALKLVDTADWYKFTSVGTGTSAHSVSISFTNSAGDLQLALYSASGTQLASSQGNGNTETISLNNRAAGTYVIRVIGTAGATNPNYTLTINPPPTPPPGSGFTITLAMTGMTTSQQAIFNQASAKWSQIITGDLPNATYQGQVVDDVLIAASAVPIDGPGGILGQAAPDAFRTGSQLPYHGFMEFDTADMATYEANGQLLSIILHEMGHVLGVGTIWSRLGLLSGRGTANPLFTGPQATAAYNQIFGTTATGVPVENSGGGGTRDAHWRETIFQTELMTGFLNANVPNPLSRITAASMADMGYTVNLAAADLYTKPAGFTSLVVQPSGGNVGSSLGRNSSYFSRVDTMQPELSLQMPLPSAATIVRPPSRPALDATATQFDAEVVDAAVTTEYQQGDAETSEDILLSDEPDDANSSFAWEDFEPVRRPWSSVAQL